MHRTAVHPQSSDKCKDSNNLLKCLLWFVDVCVCFIFFFFLFFCVCFSSLFSFCWQKLIWQNGNRARFFNPLKRCKLHVKKCRIKCLQVCQQLFLQNICLTLTGFGWMRCASMQRPEFAGANDCEKMATQNEYLCYNVANRLSTLTILSSCELSALIWNH